MKKALRIVLLVLAILAFGFSIYVCVEEAIILVDIIKHYNENSDFYPDFSYFKVFRASWDNIRAIICCVFLALFSFIYTFFTLKNGLGAELYSYAHLTIDEMRRNRDTKRAEDIKSTVETLESKIDTLNDELKTLENNTKSDE